MSIIYNNYIIYIYAVLWRFSFSVAFSVFLWIVIKPTPRTQRLDPGFEALIQSKLISQSENQQLCD